MDNLFIGTFYGLIKCEIVDLVFVYIFTVRMLWDCVIVYLSRFAIYRNLSIFYANIFLFLLEYKSSPECRTLFVCIFHITQMYVYVKILIQGPFKKNKIRWVQNMLKVFVFKISPALFLESFIRLFCVQNVQSYKTYSFWAKSDKR